MLPFHDAQTGWRRYVVLVCLVLMAPPRHAPSLALRGRGVRLARAGRGDDSFPYTDEGHPLAAKDGFRDVAVAVVSTPALTTPPAT